MTNAQFIHADPRVARMHVALAFMRQVGPADLVIDASASQFVLNRHAQGVEADLAVGFTHSPAIDALPPERLKIDWLRESGGCLGALQFLEHLEKVRVQWLCANPAALLVKRDLTGVRLTQENVAHWVHARLTNSDPVLYGDEVRSPKDCSFWLWCVLDVRFQFLQGFVGQFDRLVFFRFAKPKFSARVSRRVTTEDSLLHNHPERPHFEQGRVARGFVQSQFLPGLHLGFCLAFRCNAPRKVIEAMLPGKVTRRMNAIRLEKDFQGFPNGEPAGECSIIFVSDSSPTPVLAVLSFVINPLVPFFVCAMPGDVDRVRALLERVFGLQFIRPPDMARNVVTQPRAESGAFAVRRGAMGQVKDVATFNYIGHGPTLGTLWLLVNSEAGIGPQNQAWKRMNRHGSKLSVVFAEPITYKLTLVLSGLAHDCNIIAKSHIETATAQTHE